MSSDSDRISVPTNGKRPHSVTTMTASTAAAAGRGRRHGRHDRADGDGADAAPTGSSSLDLPGGLSPQQLAIGFGIVASVLAIGAGIARRRVRR